MAAAASSPFRAGRPSIVLVVAVSENGVIGRDNELPWRLKSDLRHFRAVTMGKPVIMGRNTFLSIGKPLTGRTNIVLSRDSGFAAPGIVMAGGLDAALTVAQGDALRRGVDEIAVIGGAELFRQTLPMADRLELTQVHMTCSGDICFPAVDATRWRETARRDAEAGPGDDAAMTFITYAAVDRAGGQSGAAL